MNQRLLCAPQQLTGQQTMLLCLVNGKTLDELTRLIDPRSDAGRSDKATLCLALYSVDLCLFTYEVRVWREDILSHSLVVFRRASVAVDKAKRETNNDNGPGLAAFSFFPKRRQRLDDWA